MWFLYALSVALITSVSAIIAKKVMRELSEYQYLFISGLFIIPFLLFIVLKFYQIPKIDSLFSLFVLANIIIGSIAGIIAYKAIKISEISLIAPISAFNPVFTALIALVFLNERLSPQDWLGIFLICFGAYVLQISSLKAGWMAPFKDLFTNKGVMLSLTAYFLWAITPLFEKSAIFRTIPQTPPFVSLTGQIGTTFIFGLLASKSLNKKTAQLVKKNLRFFFLIGVLWAIASSLAMITFSTTNLGIATSIFKLSMIFTVILGWLLFKEKHIKERVLGTLVMLLGVIFLVS